MTNASPLWLGEVAAASWWRPRIVLLEDEPVLVEMLGIIIRGRLGSVDLVVFENGDEAWDDLCRQAPDLFITDCCHPGLQGPEILRKLAERRDAFPIIWSCGCERGAHEREAELRGLTLTRVPKPYAVGEFQAVLGQMLGR